MKQAIRSILISSLLLSNVGIYAIQNPLRKVGEWGTELQGYPAKMKAWAKKVWLCRPTNPASWCTKEEVAKSRKILGGALTTAMVAAFTAIGITAYALNEENRQSRLRQQEKQDVFASLQLQKTNAVAALQSVEQTLDVKEARMVYYSPDRIASNPEAYFQLLREKNELLGDKKYYEGYIKQLDEQLQQYKSDNN